MAKQSITIYRGRTNVIDVALGVDYSGDTFVSEVRERQGADSPIILTFTIDDSDIANGNLVLTADDSITDVPDASGWMDVLRISGGEPLTLFAHPLEVKFRNMPTGTP